MSGPTDAQVDADAQAAFVQLSGDANPLHTDPLVARRLPFGRVAVHGMHLALLALDGLAAGGQAAGRVRATFRHPVGVGDAIRFEIEPGVCLLTVDGRPVADVRIDGDRTCPAGRPLAPPASLAPLAPAGAPADLGLDRIDGLSGSIPVAGDVAAITQRFAHLPVVTVAELLAVTRVVGMHVPGLHSMLSSFDLTLDDVDPVHPLELEYRVASVDERFSKVVIRVDGPGVRGSVTAFVRPAPSDQRVGTGAVTPGEFDGVRALVVGGSRGLGAAAAQLLAAGGAEVRLTYHLGADDAAVVAASSPGATAHPLDVTDPLAEQRLAVITDGWHPTLLAWFASPPIFVGARGAYSQALVEQFRAVYVDAFVRTVEHIGPDSLTAILWPSSEAVVADVPGLAEYADAKRAGEQVCAGYRAANPHLVVHAPRFPRLRTDQTASFVPVDADDPAPHVLAALRACARPQPG